MPAYLTLINWTDQGAKSATETVDRFETARDQMQQLGVAFTTSGGRSARTTSLASWRHPTRRQPRPRCSEPSQPETSAQQPCGLSVLTK